MMKIEVSNEGDTYSLTAAVLVYTNTHGRAFATRHFVDEHKGAPSIGPGQPLSDGDYRNLVKALGPKERPGMQWNDPRVLATGLGRMMWWSAPKERSLFFKTSPHIKGTFDGRGLVPCPGLVFMGSERSLYVFAFKGQACPTQETALYQAPFFNVWSSGQVCTGNAALPEEHQRGDPGSWEQMFFGSHFTHPNFSERDRLTLGIHPVDFWKGLIDAPPEGFPEEVLVPLDINLGHLLELDAVSSLHQRPRAQGEF
jgi:PRTRC genetic system protein B